MAVVMLATVSCKKEQFMYTWQYTVTPAQWITNAYLDYYYAPFENVDITQDVVDNGCVMVYIIDSENRQAPLPCEIFRSGQNDAGETVLYSDNFTYDIQRGIITFKFQASDFDNDASIGEYGNITFKVCVLASK